jgi:SAM-dependent methyltransferase
MQKDKTLQFWDEYHTDHDQKEWISQPDEGLLAMICKHIHIQPHTILSSRITHDVDQSTKKDHCYDDPIDRNRISSTCTSCSVNEDECRRIHSLFRILEIGCGTSTLVRDLKLYVEEKHFTQQQQYRQVFACGTDVSPICVDTCQQRDQDLILQSNGTLHYKVLNVLLKNDNDDDDNGSITADEKVHAIGEQEVANQEQQKQQRHPWDLIIDKGCLDTFLFRTRQRGESGVYPESIRQVLDNIHTMMMNGPSSRYMFISPRSKLRAVRDYIGFQSVHRYPLPFDTVVAAEIVRRKADCSRDCSTNNNNNSNSKSNDEAEGNRYINSISISHKSRPNDNKNSNSNKPHGYLYVCSKNEEYVAHSQNEAFRTEHRDLPDDQRQCNRCKTSFLDFRHGEAVEGRGLVFWTREFKNHCIHCKG